MENLALELTHGVLCCNTHPGPSQAEILGCGILSLYQSLLSRVNLVEFPPTETSGLLPGPKDHLVLFPLLLHHYPLPATWNWAQTHLQLFLPCSLETKSAQVLLVLRSRPVYFQLTLAIETSV